MRNIPRPIHTVLIPLERCINSITNEDFKHRLLSTLDLLLTSEADYATKAANSQLFSIAEASIIGEVSVAEMKSIYATFSRKGGPTRDIYDAIKLGAIGNICPLCNQRTVSTLDHYLAKSKHPALAITPLNLVPSCKDCNTDTGTRRPTTAGEQTLHPYFDNVDDAIWLTASVTECSPPVVVFAPSPSALWSQAKQDMVRSHFRTFDLGKLYTTHAAVELVNIYYDVSRIFNINGATDVRNHLLEQANNRRHVMKNSWQAATYEGLADSIWFCSGGFESIL